MTKVPSAKEVFDAYPIRGELFNITQLIKHAKAIAATHTVTRVKGKSFLLERLGYNATILHDFNREALLLKDLRSATPAAQWLIDNFYMIDGQIQLARHQFSKEYNAELPSLTSGAAAGLPRVYDLTLELVSHVDAQIDIEALRAFIEAYQSVSQLTMGELWAIPTMLHLALIENLQRIATHLRKHQKEQERAASWADKLLEVAMSKPSQLIGVVADMARADIPSSSTFVSELHQRLSQQHLSLQIARNWLEQRLLEEGTTIEEQLHIESQAQAAIQLSATYSINSLRLLNNTDWKTFIETSSSVEQKLRHDPAGIYSTMDFATRDHYRHKIEKIARNSPHSEMEVVEATLALAAQANPEESGAQSRHVGFYLIGDGRKHLASKVGERLPAATIFARAVRRWPLFFYGGSITLLTLLSTAVFVWLLTHSFNISLPDGRALLLSLFFMFCMSQVAVDLVNWLFMQLMRPKVLPRLDFSQGIPEQYRSMVVMPTMLFDKAAIATILRTLELHYLANRDPALHFALLTDFIDAKSESTPEDAGLLEHVKQGIQALNAQYATENTSTFYLVHRPRLMNEKEGVWMGFERKRGKLMQFTALLRGGDTAAFSCIEGDQSIFTSIKYVVTLDEDTELPRDTVHQLVGAMAHPLNHAVIDEARNVVHKGYGVLQPRISINLFSGRRSIYNQLLSGDLGIDPYTRTISDVYQDIFREGSFVGKGIYDVDVFWKVLGKRFPRNRVLSHDLLESAYVRSALISDVEIYDSYPSCYFHNALRRHRWVRGDWQNIPWLLPFVSNYEGKWAPNPISLLAKWKIVDNLRRSLIPPALLLFLMLSFLLFPQKVYLGPLVVFGIVCLPVVLSLITGVLNKPKDQQWHLYLLSTLRKVGRLLRESLLSLALLPFEAYCNSHAIVVSLWRLVVTKKQMLQWKSSMEVERESSGSLSFFYSGMNSAPIIALLCAILIFLANPSLLPYSLPILLIWMLSPALAWRISEDIEPEQSTITPRQKEFLHKIARKTWHFFEEFVTAKENWLPPDNYQEVPNPVIAARTSPTNIGGALLSSLAAYDFNYLPVGALLERTQHSFATLASLEKYNGHLYNWYDTRTLEPLMPRYISSVDSGNLAGHLFTFAQGIKELHTTPIYRPGLFQGLLDTLRVIREYKPPQSAALQQLEKELHTIPSGIHAALSVLQSVQSRIDSLLPIMPTVSSELQTWSTSFKRDCEYHVQELRYLAPWVSGPSGLSNELPLPESTTNAAAAAIFAKIVELDQGPNLSQSLRLQQELSLAIETFLTENTGEVAHKYERERVLFRNLLPELQKAKKRASHRLQLIDSLVAQAESFARAMDFSFLYNAAKKMFSIGFNVSEERMDSASYDMLASEARLCSYIAIAQGMVPQEHWFSLSRLLVIPYKTPVLLSWSGSMFEYLMPLLVMPNYPDTLLDTTYKGAVQAQIEYGKMLGVPWGISESGYNRTDTSMNYQYKAFGVPSLGAKRGLSEDLVVTPYATVMALMVAPEKACANLQRLSKEGYEGIYGYYEAIDYTPAHLRPGQLSESIRSFMAHHQSMSFLSLANVLQDNCMQRRFMDYPLLEADRFLLQERMPCNIAAKAIRDDSEFEIEGLHPLLTENKAGVRKFKDNTITPELNLLSNGRYHVMLSNTGGGYSRWHDLAVTRWREDAVCDNLGMFIYMRDTVTGEFFSATHQPTLHNTGNCETTFTPDSAEFYQQHDELEIRTTVCVSPEDDMELRNVHISNHSKKERILEFTSFAEVVIAPQAADIAHPAFSNLFVQTEFIPSLAAVLCTRRARSQEEKPPHLVHMLLLSPRDEQGSISCETDRSHFIGRGRSLTHPQAMDIAGSLSNSSGAVLDPAVALRRTVCIPAGGTRIVGVLLGMAETRKAIIELAEKYQDIRMAERAFELSWNHSQILLTQLGIVAKEAQLYSHLAGCLVYSNALRRAPQVTLQSNRRSQDGLWGYGISGDLPLVLVRVSDNSGLELTRQIIRAHAYWRMKGLESDLLIINEDTSVYRQSLHEAISSLVASSMEGFLLEKSGGIFVRRLEQVPREDQVLLETCARLVLDDKLGSLSEQLQSLNISYLHTPSLKTVPATVEQPQELAPRDVLFANGLGGFTPAGDEYVISLHAGQTTPAPWCNVIANKHFGTVISESGSAYTWANNAHMFRLTPWHNDPVRDSSGEAFYIRDDATGQFWSPTPLPAKGKTPYVVRHGFGYTVFEHSENGIESELTVYVALNAPIKYGVLKLRNVSGRARKISVSNYYEWVFGDFREKNMMHVQSSVDVQTGLLYARNFYNIESSGKIAFVDVGESRTFTSDRVEFIGQNGSLAKPAAMQRTRLSGKVGAGLDPCGAVQVSFTLEAQQERTTRFRLGFANNRDEMRALALEFRKSGMAENTLTAVREYWKHTLSAITVDTPNPAVNVMANGWLIYQALSSRMWGRSGYYQSGGAYGFRDQLQDTLALVHAEPKIAREHIIRAAGRQFPQGDVQHWWHPPSGRGVRTHFSDDYLWLPFVACNYIRSIGDAAILDVEIPFIEGRPLGADEESYYDLPGRSAEVASLYEHCVRSIEYGLKFGKHGLPLIGCGDWNDGMNLIGKEGRGESVWLGFFLYTVLMQFSELALARKDTAFATRCTEQAKKLQENLEKNAWDGEWYRRAYFDDGQPLGSKSNEECRIDSLSQSWAIISKAGNPKRALQAMEQVDKQLVNRKHKLIHLFSPPFDKSALNPGYIKGYVPGVRENGGQYTHGVIWTVLAFALMGETEKAWELFHLINPVHHGDSPEQIAIYKVEPYVVAADVYAVEQHTGRGGWTWYTGAGSWMYCLLVETLLGIQRKGDTLHLEPRLPQEWEGYAVRYRYKETVYAITFKRITDASKPRLLIDGDEFETQSGISLSNDGKTHAVIMWIW